MATVDFFLRLDGIKGESKDRDHKDEIDVLAWQWGEASNVDMSGGGGGAGKAIFHALTVRKLTDTSSVALLLACASGKHIRNAVLTCRRRGRSKQEFLKVTLENVVVSAFNAAGDSGSGETPSEDVALNYAKVIWSYRPTKPDGSLGGEIKGGWDLIKNEKI